MKYFFIALSVLLLSIPQTVFTQSNDLRTASEKSAYLLQMIQYAYVDPVPLSPLVEKGIVEILKQLDPHSQYISSKDVDRANEALRGDFDGIGISFQVVDDTIVVLEAIKGGPSEKLGIIGGDKIIAIDEKNATGDSANTEFVFNHLRGKKGTVVYVDIYRNGDVREYKIVRDKIPIYSIETYFMENKHTGYIQVDRFSKQTAKEFKQVLQTLISQGAKNIILDLRRNTGGYMDQAIEMANEFLESNLLIVYMQGAMQQRQNSYSNGGGIFKNGKLVVLIDEHSASASEIISGAIQDQDRGIIVGRRSFGKGLVQRPFNLPDKSEVRLTIARYYTPSGRCVQKPYNDGLDKYYSDMMDRYKHGELVHPDSIRLPDSLKFYTSGNRVVYGGGGIMPDIFTPLDTNRISDYFIELNRNQTIYNFVMAYINKERQNLLKNYPTFEVFDQQFEVDGEFTDEFHAFAEKSGIKRKHIRIESAENFLNEMIRNMKNDTNLLKSENYGDYVKNVLWSEKKMSDFLTELAAKEDAVQDKAKEFSDIYIIMQVKALLARNLYGEKCFFQTMRSFDEAYQRALKTVEDEALFQKLKISY